MGELRVTVLGSGSDGNGTVLDYKDGTIHQSILLDCGVSRLSKLYNWDSLSGIYITHGHSDHVKSIQSTVRVKDAPVYITRPEWESERLRKYFDKMTCYTPRVKFITPTKPIVDGVFKVTPIPAHHDTEMPVHYMIEVAGKRIFYGCDTADVSLETLDYIVRADIVLIECNYDDDAFNSDKLNGLSISEVYPDELKDRIRYCGHLSVQQLQRILMFVRPEVDVIVTHVSKTYNSKENILKRIPRENLLVTNIGEFPTGLVIKC